ncbi:hypothetical protein ABWH97_11325 [Nitratireductor sp. ac15]
MAIQSDTTSRDVTSVTYVSGRTSFISEFNEERPHEALAMKTPAESLCALLNTI